MTTTLSSQNVNKYINTLELISGARDHSIDCLVIVHDDANLSNALSEALQGSPSAILEIPQDKWDFTKKEFTEAITWAIQKLEIQQLLLVGNVNESALNKVSSVSSTPTLKSVPGFHKLLAGVRNYIDYNCRARERFVKHVEQMTLIPQAEGRWLNGALSICGLLYQSENRLFLAYDAAKRTFEPLGCGLKNKGQIA